MTDDVITDLKQFITATISQQSFDLQDQVDRLEFKFDRGLAEVRDEIQNGFEMISDALDQSIEEHGSQFKNHDRRITKLEQWKTIHER